MLVELATAAVFMVQSNYPLESTSDYRTYVSNVSEHIEVRNKRREARIEERRQARREERQLQREAVVEVPLSNTTESSSTDLPPTLALIRNNESRGDYSAYNGSGCEGYGCYGAYQLHGLYMDDWARRYGAAAYADIPANQWPPSIQDKVALGLYYSTNPNGKFWCDWTDYC